MLRLSFNLTSKWPLVRGLIRNVEDKPPIRIPLAAPLETRPSSAFGGSYTTDSFLVNSYVETQLDGRKFVVKRPGSAVFITYNGGGATNAQGTAYYKGGFLLMGSNVLYNNNSSGNIAATGATWTLSSSAPWKGRSNFGCTIFNGQVVILGGGNTGGLVKLNDVWATSDMINWVQTVSAAPWAARSEMGVVVLGTTLYVIGGASASASFNDVWSTTDLVNWTQVVGQAPWTPRYGFGCIVFNQGIFVMGGTDSTGTKNDVWFSPDGTTWTSQVVSASWAARRGMSTLVYNQKLWIAGGYSGSVDLSSVYSSPDGINWTNTGSLPSIRSYMAATVYANKMFFMTGTNSTTVWSSVDGATFTVVTSNYGFAGQFGAAMVAFPALLTASPNQYDTMWFMGGGTGLVDTVYSSTLDVAQPASFAPSTSATTTEQWQFTTQNLGRFLVVKNTTDAWVLAGGTLQKIVSSNYPSVTVPGVVNLDDTVYVMTPTGVIQGSNLSDPFTWSANNYITADYAADAGVAIAKYQNYLLALKSSSSQLFYDAGRYPGSPLLPVIQYNSRIGCIAASTVQSLNNTVIWVARTEELGPYVVALEGNSIVKISDTQVDKLLQSWFVDPTKDYSASWRTQGHYFYMLSISQFAITLVYDFTEKLWHIEQSLNAGEGTSGVYSVLNYVTEGLGDYMQDKSLGFLYRLEPDVFQDSGVTINCTGQTVMVDGGINDRKFTAGLTVIGDRRATFTPNNLLVQWSDDDAQTWSSPQTVDLTKARPRISRTGSFRRRRYRWIHATNNPMRLEALEQEIS